MYLTTHNLDKLDNPGAHSFGKVFSNKASHMRSANMYECRIIQRVVYEFKNGRSHFLIYSDEQILMQDFVKKFLCSDMPTR